jgi:NAD(P)-dependent dehydrogenase (short-subunit alcohol dehydrogenase family)
MTAERLRALVTGASGGIGGAVCMMLAAAGFEVIGVGRSEARLLELVRRGAATDLQVRTMRCDVSDRDQVADVLRAAGAVDVLVHSAGITSSEPVLKVQLETWNEVIRVNATSALILAQGVLPGMKERGFGRLVFVASTLAHAGYPYTASYAASKHALVGLARVIAAELAGTHVTCNCVCPTYVRTPMTARTVTGLAAKARRDEHSVLSSMTAGPLGRLLEPDEVAEAVLYFASARSDAVNGQSLLLDGGALQR